MDVHADIDQTEKPTVEKKCDCHRRNGRGENQARQQDRLSNTTDDDNRACTELRDERAGELHRQNRPGTEAQEEEPQRALVDVEPRLGKRHQRRPAQKRQVPAFVGPAPIKQWH